MAHFAELDENNIVTQVIVVDNKYLLDDDGQEKESLGIVYLHQLLGPERRWVQTSYNDSFRSIYAGIGFSYDPVLDVFTPSPESELVEDYTETEGA